MELKKTTTEVKNILDFAVRNSNLEGVYGDGISIPEVPEVPIKHSFADQIYIRQANLPAGYVVVGCVHNHLHTWFLLTGSICVIEGDEKVVHIAPCYTVSSPGAQRAIYALEDCIFVNVHKNPSNTQDIKELEQEIVSMTMEEFNKKNSKL